MAPGNANSIYSAVANSNAAFQSGFANGATLTQLQKAVPLGFATPNFNTIAPGFNNPKYFEWNFEVQQALGSGMSFSINYVGNKGIDEALQNLYLNAYSASGFSGLPTSKPDPRFGQIRELYDTGYSHYNGLVTSTQVAAEQSVLRFIQLHLLACDGHLLQRLPGTVQRSHLPELTIPGSVPTST